jgi:hypothetical protein
MISSENHLDFLHFSSMTHEIHEMDLFFSGKFKRKLLWVPQTGPHHPLPPGAAERACDDRW